MSEIPIYPPLRHVLRDLGLVFPFTVTDDALVAYLDVGDGLLDENGKVRVGFLATCCDLVAGQLARGRVAPDWVATADLELHRLRDVGTGRLEIRGRVLREARGAVISRIELASKGGGEPVAVGSVSFSRLPSQQTRQPGVMERRVEGGGGGGEVEDPGAPPSPDDRSRGSSLLERIGFAPAAGGGIQLTLHDYIRNSLGGLQGGLSAVLLELASECAAVPALGDRVSVSDLFVRYLNVGRVGPFRARGRLLRREGAECLLEAEVVDLGADERQVVLGTLVARACGRR